MLHITLATPASVNYLHEKIHCPGVRTPVLADLPCFGVVASKNRGGSPRQRSKGWQANLPEKLLRAMKHFSVFYVFTSEEKLS
jgi:hypothetical protein